MKMKQRRAPLRAMTQQDLFGHCNRCKGKKQISVMEIKGNGRRIWRVVPCTDCRR
jgi:hypothetical protein